MIFHEISLSESDSIFVELPILCSSCMARRSKIIKLLTCFICKNIWSGKIVLLSSYSLLQRIIMLFSCTTHALKYNI